MSAKPHTARGSRALPLIAILLALAAAVLFSPASPARADVPTITSINPTTGPTNGGTLVTITGTGFHDGDGDPNVTAVTFGGVPATQFTVNSNTSISAVVPAHAAGAVAVVVTTPDGPSTEVVTFTYHPFVTSVNPTAGPNTGGTLVTITGGGFTPGSTVMFGATPAASVVFTSSTSLTATSPVHATGTVAVTVTTNGVASPAHAGAQFTFGVLPAITNLNPNSGPAGGGTSVTITGTNFTGATQVTFGGNLAAFVVNSSTSITATAPAHAAGQVHVRVTTPIGTSAEVAASQYTYTAGAAVPTITGLNPASGPASGGTVVEITGTNFTGATAVNFGATAATSFTVNSATSITAVAPALAAGSVFVRVTTPSGTSADVAAAQFTATTGRPVITSLDPAGGPTTGGTTVTITGSGFTGATSVVFGDTAAVSFTVNSATSITAVAPSRPAGTVFVIITAPAGTSSPTVSSRYTYGNLPTITSINPTSGPITGGTTVTITGSGFTGATAVSFGGTAATSFTVVSDTSITAVSPARAAGTVFIRVTTPVGQSAEVTAAQFTYGTPASQTVTYTLHFRWTLIAWLGRDGISVTNALSGSESAAANNISGQVTAIYRWNATLQRWQANFPGTTVPGANDFTTLEHGAAYFIAISSTGSITWTIVRGP